MDKKECKCSEELTECSQEQCKHTEMTATTWGDPVDLSSDLSLLGMISMTDHSVTSAINEMLDTIEKTWSKEEDLSEEEVKAMARFYLTYSPLRAPADTALLTDKAVVHMFKMQMKLKNIL